MNIKFLPIKPALEDNTEFIGHPDCEGLNMSVLFYARVGYSVPWIGYYVSIDDVLVGSCGFKGRPMNGKVEIAYGTFPAFQNKGIGALICRRLVEVAQITDPSVIITARTLREENYSTKILRKNGFIYKGVVTDPEDGKVWEWEYSPMQ